MLDTLGIKSQFLNLPAGPPKDISVSQPSESMKVTLFGKRIFTNAKIK